jgi:hypothetical protein
MRRTRTIVHEFLPWAGLVVGIIAAGFVHQFGSDSVFDDCSTAAPVPLLIAAVAGLALCILAGLLSWRSRRSDSGARRVAAAISVGCAALFAFAIILPMVAALILPPCFG